MKLITLKATNLSITYQDSVPLLLSLGSWLVFMAYYNYLLYMVVLAIDTIDYTLVGL